MEWLGRIGEESSHDEEVWFRMVDRGFIANEGGMSKSGESWGNGQRFGWVR